VKRVLVTGGSGFIGSHVVDALLRREIEPRIFDLRPSPHHRKGTVKTAIGDLTDVGALRKAAKDCDAIIHLAASADVGIVAEDPEGAEKANARGTLSVLEAARSTGVRVVYGSTIWVYGESGEGVLDEEAPLGMPLHLYTATKLAGEMYCTSYAELYEVPYTILRFGIPYGPRARPAAVIPIFVNKAMAGDPLTIAGDGKQTRRFVYVEDLADGVVRALDPQAENRIYNLASNETVTIRELAEVVRGATRNVEITHTPGRTGDFGGAEISSRRAEEELGWAASTPIEEGVGRYVDWAQSEGLFEPMPDVAEEPEPALRERLLTGVGVTALACAVGMMIPWLLSLRTDDFGQGQAHTIAFTTLIGILASLSVLPSVGIRVARTGLMAAWFLAAFLVLALMPWSRDALTLARPSLGTLALTAIGTGTALTVAAAADRLREPQEPAPDHLA
jgi:UDP-glucose 4-epimerase